MSEELGRAEAEGGAALRGLAQESTYQPRGLQGDRRSCPDNLKGRKSQTLVLFLGGIVFLFFKFLLEFCLRILCDLFHKKKKRKEKAIIGKIRLCGVVHFRGRGGVGVGMWLLARVG